MMYPNPYKQQLYVFTVLCIKLIIARFVKMITWTDQYHHEPNMVPLHMNSDLKQFQFLDGENIYCSRESHNNYLIYLELPLNSIPSKNQSSNNNESQMVFIKDNLETNLKEDICIENKNLMPISEDYQSQINGRKNIDLEQQISTKIDEQQKIQEKSIQLSAKKIKVESCINPESKFDNKDTPAYHSQIYIQNNCKIPKDPFVYLENQQQKQENGDLQEEKSMIDSQQDHYMEIQLENLSISWQQETIQTNCDIYQESQHFMHDNHPLIDFVAQLNEQFNPFSITIQFMQGYNQNIFSQSQINAEENQCSLSSIDINQSASQNSNSDFDQFNNTLDLDHESSFDRYGLNYLDQLVLSVLNNHQIFFDRVIQSFCLIFHNHWDISKLKWRRIENHQNFNFVNQKIIQEEVINIATVKVTQSEYLIIMGTKIKCDFVNEEYQEILLSYNLDQDQYLNEESYQPIRLEQTTNFNFYRFRQDLFANKMNLGPQHGFIRNKHFKNFTKKYPDNFCTETNQLSIKGCQFFQIYPAIQ